MDFSRKFIEAVHPMTVRIQNAIDSVHTLLIGPGDHARQFARKFAESLPVLSAAKSKVVVELFHQAGLPFPGLTEFSPAVFRAPHFTSHEIGIFGGGQSRFPGEIGLATFGVLFLQDIDRFRLDMIERLASCLAQSQPESFPTLFFHAEVVDRVPAAILDLKLHTIRFASNP